MTEECRPCNLILADGSRISWREWGAGKPLIMLHGWSMSSAVFSEVASQLAEDFRILCPDLPGHGDSEPVLSCSLEAFASRLELWIKQLNLPAASLLGWSLGGQVALQIALNGRVALSHLLLVATTPRFSQTDNWPHGLPQTQLRALDRNLGRAFEKTMGDFFNQQFSDGEVNKERYRQILQFAVRPTQLPEVEQARETLKVLGVADLRGQLRTLRVPTQVLHGQLDRIIPIGAGAFLAEEIPGAEFCRVPEVGHAPFFSQPDLCLQYWRRFIT